MHQVGSGRMGPAWVDGRLREWADWRIAMDAGGLGWPSATNLARWSRARCAGAHSDPVYRCVARLERRQGNERDAVGRCHEIDTILRELGDAEFRLAMLWYCTALSVRAKASLLGCHRSHVYRAIESLLNQVMDQLVLDNGMRHNLS